MNGIYLLEKLRHVFEPQIYFGIWEKVILILPKADLPLILHSEHDKLIFQCLTVAQQNHSHNGYLETSLPSLDGVLHGGLPVGTITEVNYDRMNVERTPKVKKKLSMKI